MRIDILTLFPEMFEPVLSASILGRAREGGFAGYFVHNIRDWADNKHDKVDDRPFGGGPGMVLMCQPLYDAVIAVEAMDSTPAQRIVLSPQGEILRQQTVEQLAARPRLLLIAGHYEGIDERVSDDLDPLELSVGDYVTAGGGLPAMGLPAAGVWVLKGGRGAEQAAAQDSVAPQGPAGQRLLDCPHYTRPRVWKGRSVPDVLLSGDHQAVDAWRAAMMLDRTRQRRPDLLEERH